MPHKEAVENKHPENEGLAKREPGTNPKWFVKINPGEEFGFSILESGAGISSWCGCVSVCGCVWLCVAGISS